jgi:tRNA threonylcarbamoyladenosine biosynthesis protein TsaE
MRLELPDVNATETLGRELGALLFPGAVVALIGPLGAGKTYLVQAIAEGLGVARGAVVTSPTFVLIQEYEGRLPIYHFDAYRLADEQAFADLGVGEYFEGDGVCLVEWADRVARTLPEDHLQVVLEIGGETSRRVTLTASGNRYQALVASLISRLAAEEFRLISTPKEK